MVVVVVVVMMEGAQTLYVSKRAVSGLNVVVSAGN